MFGVPLKKTIAMASMVVVTGTGLTGVYNYASAKVEEHQHPLVMKAAATCEAKLTAGNFVKGESPCTADEQYAMLTREQWERREWSGGARAGISMLIIMAAL